MSAARNARSLASSFLRASSWSPVVAFPLPIVPVSPPIQVSVLAGAPRLERASGDLAKQLFEALFLSVMPGMSRIWRKNGSVNLTDPFRFILD